MDGEHGPTTTLFETETIYDCEMPIGFKTLYKHLGVNGLMVGAEYNGFDGKFFGEEDNS